MQREVVASVEKPSAPEIQGCESALAEQSGLELKPKAKACPSDEMIGLHIPIQNGILRIPANVSEIFDGQFAGRKDIVAIEFEVPILLQTIGRAAFCDCSNLRQIRFPMKMPLIKIGEDAFRRCAALESLDLPNGVEQLGDNAFSQCGDLAELQLPPTLTRIGAGAFSLCFRLKRVVIPLQVCTIGPEAFYLSQSKGQYIALDFGGREDFTGIDRGVLRESRHCPVCGKPRTLLRFRQCSCGAKLT